MRTVSSRILFGVTANESIRLLGGFPKYLENFGFEVKIVASPGKLPLNQDEQKLFHFIKMEREPSFFRDLVAFICWVRLVNLFRPTTVVIGTPKAALLGLLAAWLTRVPRRIYHLRGLRSETTIGLKHLFLLAIEKVSCSLSTEILVVSVSLKEAALKLRLAPESKMFMIGIGSSNGVEISKSNELQNLPKFGPLTFGFVGRITKDKGIFTLLEAYKEVLDTNSEARLVIIGQPDGSPEIHKALDELKELGAEIINHQENPDFIYKRIDCLCLPTFREGFPNVVLEAAARGIPCITTYATGAVDSVLHNQTGLLVKAGDSRDLARAMLRMVTDRKLLSFTGQNAYKYVSDNFNRDDYWQKFADFLSAPLPD